MEKKKRKKRERNTRGEKAGSFSASRLRCRFRSPAPAPQFFPPGPRVCTCHSGVPARQNLPRTTSDRREDNSGYGASRVTGIYSLLSPDAGCSGIVLRFSMYSTDS